MQGVNWISLSVFLVLFGLITWLGFAAANWRKGDLDQLHEWGLGGRRFGTVVTWFLIGGDLYTAYTFIAVPALAFGAGARRKGDGERPPSYPPNSAGGLNLPTEVLTYRRRGRIPSRHLGLTKMRLLPSPLRFWNGESCLPG